MGRGELRQRGLEAVANTRLGLDQLATELLAEGSHHRTQVVRFALVLWSPHLAQQLPVGEHPASLERQELEEFVLDRSEMDGLTAQANEMPLDVQLHIAKVQYRLRGGGPGTAQRYANAGVKLLHAERLGEVVVRAGLQRAHLIGLLAHDRQDDDRNLGPAADLLQRAETAHLRHGEVEQDHVRRPALNLDQALGAVPRDFDLIAQQLEPAPHAVADLGLVIDHQHARGHAYATEGTAGSVTSAACPRRAGE